jgi:hypothetical protein
MQWVYGTGRQQAQVSYNPSSLAFDSQSCLSLPPTQLLCPVLSSVGCMPRTELALRLNHHQVCCCFSVRLLVSLFPSSWPTGILGSANVYLQIRQGWSMNPRPFLPEAVVEKKGILMLTHCSQFQASFSPSMIAFCPV